MWKRRNELFRTLVNKQDKGRDGTKSNVKSLVGWKAMYMDLRVKLMWDYPGQVEVYPIKINNGWFQSRAFLEE